jgi:hypothetical protein
VVVRLGSDLATVKKATRAATGRKGSVRYGARERKKKKKD